MTVKILISHCLLVQKFKFKLASASVKYPANPLVPFSGDLSLKT